MSSLVKQSFLSLATSLNIDAEWYKNHSADYVVQDRIYLDAFDADYENIVLSYIEASGCNIVRTNHNCWDDNFYIWYTKPTKTVDPSEFFDTYKPRYRYNAIHGLWFFNITAIIAIIAFIAIFGK